MSFEGPEEMRGVHVHAPEISHIIWSWGVKLYLSWFSTLFIVEGSFTMYYSVFEWHEEMTGSCVHVPEVMLYLSQFPTVIYC